MDSLTHIALGACIGEAFAGKQLGKRAMFLGAVAQSLPDIDFLASFWMNTSDNLLAHRGFTHSFLFILLAAPLLGLIAERWHRPHNISLLKWTLFFGVNALIHLLIDGMNSYGVGWFEPFSHVRISYNWIFVADPLYSVWLAIAFVMLLALKRSSRRRLFWVKFGIGLGTLYLVFCGFNKWQINSNVRRSLAEQHINYKNYFSTPTAFNNLLWYIVAATDSGYYIGYRSVFDGNRKLELNYFPRKENLLAPVKGHEDLQKLLRFSQGYYTVRRDQDVLVFNDLRFGQVAGWEDPNAPFAFYYYLEKPSKNRLVVQRGRFKWISGTSLRSLFQRIAGKDHSSLLK
jgi:inner membrane protein